MHACAQNGQEKDKCPDMVCVGWEDQPFFVKALENNEKMEVWEVQRVSLPTEYFCGFHRWDTIVL